MSAFKATIVKGGLTGHKCPLCQLVLSPYFSHRHSCRVVSAPKTGGDAVAVGPVGETREAIRLQCWESIFKPGRMRGKCPCCRGTRIRFKSTSGTTFQAMHIIPRSAGGPNEAWNLVPGCGCNQQMRQENLVDWMGTRGNKRNLLKRLMLRKYRSLVAPVQRSKHNRRQLVEWAMATYKPRLLSRYEQWLILDREDLRKVMR
jgi:hypothetical protein